MSARSTPAFAVGGVAPEYRCICCGAETFTMPPLEARPTCCKCCGDHPEYEDGYCISCGEERDYYSDDDVGFGSYGYQPGEPIGIPASAMDGNAANRHNNPDGWARWVAFCNACGHP